ncbi:hypothetical protein LRS06_15195 [Hymenobacter sp. J193]|uniref:hypothetical protein n=1 Tax=Hymenobacter sp. J193 TaxID=2898429 RepID=UPI0021509F87|nr:hypothetical protein [Hymenobacter sp. J193]MCR5889089.1 hypothetical protein [Hymenobacter sp. J193]
MKAPAEYLNAPVLYLSYPTGEAAESVPVVTYDDALLAVEAALADAERYRYLLMRALRRHRTDEPAVVPSLVGSTPVVPMYSDEDMAA